VEYTNLVSPRIKSNPPVGRQVSWFSALALLGGQASERVLLLATSYLILFPISNAERRVKNEEVGIR
jgi:hypothetical protein